MRLGWPTVLVKVSLKYLTLHFFLLKTIFSLKSKCYMGISVLPVSAAWEIKILF